METTNKPFRTIEEVNDYLSEDKVQCLLCDKWYIHLGIHIGKSHTLTPREYKIKFNIPLKKGLAGISLRVEKALRSKNYSHLDKFIESGRYLKTKGLKPGMTIPKLSIEMRGHNPAPLFEAVKRNVAVKIVTHCRECLKEIIRSRHALNTLRGRRQKPICKQCYSRIKNKANRLKRLKIKQIIKG